MALQAIAMCFTYNSTLTFQVLESQQQTLPVFQAWFTQMNSFKNDFELRRNIFGLGSILKASPIPDFVAQKLPEMLNQVSLLAIKMHQERQDTLKDNEEHIAKGGKETDSDVSDGEDVADAIEGEDEEFADSDEEWKEQQRLFAKLGPKLHAGGKLTQAEMDEFGVGDDDEDDDSDYDYAGGEAALYDSAADDVDELKFLRDTITMVRTQDEARFQNIMTGIAKPDVRNQFDNVMGSVDNLISKEANVT